MAETRTKRLCDVCGGYDDSPRHVRAVSTGGVPSDDFLASLDDREGENISARAIAEVLDPSSVVRHMDCCAEQGCAVCGPVIERAGTKRDAALLKLIQSEA